MEGSAAANKHVFVGGSVAAQTKNVDYPNRGMLIILIEGSAASGKTATIKYCTHVKSANRKNQTRRRRRLARLP